MIFQIVVAAAAALAASPAAPSPATPPPAAEALQVRFNRASDLAATGKCTEAIPLFEALERDPKVKPGSLPAAAIAVRKGVCLADVGRKDDGERAIALGLPRLVKAGDDFVVDVSEAHRALGDAALTRSDRARAAREYRTALESRTGRNRLPILARLARATAFDGGEAALAPTQEALALLAAPASDEKLSAKVAKETRANFLTLQARALLNQGRDAEAYKLLKDALALSGGLTSETTVAEASLRADLAMAAMLTKRFADARMYLAYTGAGRIAHYDFATAQDMDPPLCGDETGLRPEDVAVVEFGLNTDGSVMYAGTIYSHGGPQVAAAFEQAVRRWSWRAADIAKLPDFYRYLTRIELRCSTRLGSGPGMWTPMNQRLTDWARPLLTTAGVTFGQQDDTAAVRRLADDASGSIPAAVRVAALSLLACNNRESGKDDLKKAMAMASATPVPAEVVNWLHINIALADSSFTGQPPASYTRKLIALAAEPAIAADPLASATLMLEAANARSSRGDAESNARLAKVAEDARLPVGHPLRQFAWMAIANRAAAANDLAAAQQAFARTGLTEEQCALLSLPPAIRRTNVNGGDYPTSASAMGFEGWVKLEYDIKADGTTTNVRPLVAYPAMIFVDAARSIGKNLKYELTYRPAGANACSASSNNIAFRLD